MRAGELVCVNARGARMCLSVSTCVCVCACVLAVYNKAQRISNREFKLWMFLQVTESRVATFLAETCVMSHQSLCVYVCVCLWCMYVFMWMRMYVCVCVCARARVCVCVCLK